jgi:hypothetical protein
MGDKPREQPPWPACADCQITVPDEPRTQHGLRGAAPTEAVRDEGGDDIPLSQDFGPWTAELRRRAAEGMARALARVREENDGRNEQEGAGTELRRA